MYPFFKGMHDRHGKPPFDLGPLEYRDRVIQWHRDLARSLDYLETRPDVDAARLAYFGFSRGGIHGPIFTAIEPRFRASVLLSGGFGWGIPAPEIDAANFAPRSFVLTLVLHGRYDGIRPVATSARPLFQRLGTPDGRKRLALADAGHIPPRTFVIKETLPWLDTYLGPVEGE